jgi:hypothetical protein
VCYFDGTRDMMVIKYADIINFMEILQPFGYKQDSESRKKKANEVGFRIAQALRFRTLFPTASLTKQFSSKRIISIL